MSMVSHWTKVKERSRTYYFPDESVIHIDNPEAVYVSTEGTHYVSLKNDIQRIVIKNSFHCMSIEVEDGQDWIHPKPILKSDTWPMEPFKFPNPVAPFKFQPMYPPYPHVPYTPAPYYPPDGTYYKVTCDSATKSDEGVWPYIEDLFRDFSSTPQGKK